MLRALLAAPVALALAAHAFAQLPPVSPKEPPPIVVPVGTPIRGPINVPSPDGPQFLKISGANAEQKTIAIAVMQAEPVTVEKEQTITVNRAGQLIVEKRKVLVTEYRMVEKKTHMSIKGAIGMDGSGNKLTEDHLWKRLEGRKMVVISHQKEGLDAAYRDVIARDALILILPEPETVPVPVPVPEGPPIRPLPVDRNKST